MWMSDVLENPSGDELSFVGLMPKYLPFEVNKRSNKEHDDAKKDRSKFRKWDFPDTVKRSERSDKNH